RLRVPVSFLLLVSASPRLRVSASFLFLISASPCLRVPVSFLLLVSLSPGLLVSLSSVPLFLAPLLPLSSSPQKALDALKPRLDQLAGLLVGEAMDLGGFAKGGAWLQKQMTADHGRVRRAV